MNKNFPFRNIYSNDTTNLENCTSPYRKQGESYRPHFLREAVKEVSGLADAHFIQLAHGRVPWYQSKFYPFNEHLKWWSEYFEVPYEDLLNLKGINGYVRDGGDVLADFIEACREFGQAAFVSLRLNDGHHVEWCGTKNHVRGIHSVCRFMMEHKEYMFGGDLKSWGNRCQNWIYPEVTAYMLELITEQCENYDIDGFELDFMRHPHMYDVNATTFQERQRITEQFIKNVRAVLDRTERGDKHRYLCVRVPSKIEMWDELGLLPENMEKLGVEMVNVSTHYYTDQWTDFKEFTTRMPNLAVYFEACHCTYQGKVLKEGCYDNDTFRRASESEIYTTAYMAHKAGAQGMSYFNFVYYREHGVEGRGPFNEPPFEVLRNAKDVDFISNAPQHFFIAKGWEHKSQLRGRSFGPAKEHRFEIYMAEPPGKWNDDFRFRIIARDDLGDRKFTLRFNEVEAYPCEDISEPYVEDNKYPPLHATVETARAWRVSREAVKEGKNHFILTFTSKETSNILIDYIDIFPQNINK